MKIPLSWLKEYIHLTLSPSEIAKHLTEAGIEVENYTIAKPLFKGVIVGRVLEAEKHPNADKLTLATVTDGKENYSVVCGAPNCRKGLKTAFAPIGAILKEPDGKEFIIKKAKLRGVESSGMLCSSKELGLSGEEDGIMELPEYFAEGTPLMDLYSDTIFDLSLTPNLAHCYSLIGIARELSAILGLPVHMPSIQIQEADESIIDQAFLNVIDKEACPRYICRLIKNVKVGPSPEWLRTRIERSGLRSVNNIVDVTNYVLLEMGHPLHAFDYDLLEGQSIIVKKASDGDMFTTLDNKERILTSQDLMICDLKQAVAIAGVMGGLNSEVSDKTQNILLESAYFDPVTIRRTSKRLGLQTDASKRFERGTDPNILMVAIDRAAMWIEQVAGGRICSDALEASAKEFPEKVIKCRLSRTNQILGINLGHGELESFFQRLHFPFRWENQDTLVIQAPTYRVDIKSEIDLIEEVARLYGYDNIPKKSVRYQSSQLLHAPMYLFEKEVQGYLIAEGLQEFLTCDLIGPSLMNIVQDTAISAESIVTVLNPTSIEQSILRTSLLPGLLQVVKHNVNHQNHDIAGFEIGRIHFREGDSFKEQSVAGIILSGKSRPHHWEEKPKEYDFFDLKGMIENLLERLGITDHVFKNLGLKMFHSGRQASVIANSLDIGSFGEIHPSILRQLDVSQRILFTEFNLHDLIAMAKRKEKTEELAIYPASNRDWTITLSQSVSSAEIQRAIKDHATPLLENVFLLDLYRNEKLGKDFQNITLRFIYRDQEKTISQEEVEKEHWQLVSLVMSKFGNAVK